MVAYRRDFLLLTSAAIVLSLFSRVAQAQAYPTRPIHFVAPFPAGPNDALARPSGKKLSRRGRYAPWRDGDHRGRGRCAGASRWLHASIYRGPPDHHGTGAPQAQLRWQRDLIPIAAVVKSDNVLVMHPATKIHSMAELVAEAKAKPGALTFASAGHASPAHMCGEMIKRQADIDMVHVPYTSATAAMNAVLAGNVNMFCGPIGVALPQVKAGNVYALGVTGVEASPLLPGITPLAASYPGLVISAWYGLFAPSGTPDSVTNILHDEFKKIFAEPEVQPTLLALGLTREWVSGSDLVQKIASDSAKWRDFTAAANIHAE